LPEGLSFFAFGAFAGLVGAGSDDGAGALCTFCSGFVFVPDDVVAAAFCAFDFAAFVGFVFVVFAFVGFVFVVFAFVGFVFVVFAFVGFAFVGFAFVGFSAFASFAAACVDAHGPCVSPWASCAGHAFTDTVIVFFSLWQIVTLWPYWYCASEIALCASPAPPSTTKATTAAADVTTAAISRWLRFPEVLPTCTPFS
jgi:hypothetical protein